MREKRGSSVVRNLPLVLEVPGSYPRSRRGKFRCPNMLSLVSIAGMTLDKCIVLRIGTLTGCPLCRESHPMCRLKNPTVKIWSLVGFHPATRSVQSTPADNTRKRVWQYIEKERKKEKTLFLGQLGFKGVQTPHPMQTTSIRHQPIRERSYVSPSRQSTIRPSVFR